MIHSSPRNIALYNSIIISVIFALAYFSLIFWYDQIIILPGLGLTALIFVFSYVSINYSVNKFIYSKIKRVL